MEIMKTTDDFSTYYAEALEGRYDCVDRIVLNGYFSRGQQGGGFRHWWRQLQGSDETLDQNHLMDMAGGFSRRVHAFSKKKGIPIIHCREGERKHELAEAHRPKDPQYQGLFLILVAKAPGLVWEVKPCRDGSPHLQHKKPWPYVNHYHFHIIDKEWGHFTIKMSGHPPFGIQVILNGHEWGERQACKKTISTIKEGNCFVGGSDFQALDQIADTLCAPHAIGRLAEVCDRWVYSSCLSFALHSEEQRRTGFRYEYSCYQIEYSRNLLFKRGTMLDEVYQGLIDRTRRTLDVDKLKTIFGRKQRPHRRHQGGMAGQMMRTVDASDYDLTVFKVHFVRLTLKMYDKGDRVLRVEAIAHNVRELGCGRRLEKLPIMLAKLQQMAIGFLNTLEAAHLSFLDGHILDTLPQPTVRGDRRLAGVDLQKRRMRCVSEAVLALASAPEGFSMQELTEKTRWTMPKIMGRSYTARNAAYDLRKLRAKHIVQRVANTRRYRPDSKGIRLLAGLLILRDKVIQPVLTGVGKRRIGRSPKIVNPLDVHYENLQIEMRNTMRMLALVA